VVSRTGTAGTKWRTAQPLRLAAGSCRTDSKDGAALQRSFKAGCASMRSRRGRHPRLPSTEDHNRVERCQRDGGGWVQPCWVPLIPAISACNFLSRRISNTRRCAAILSSALTGDVGRPAISWRIASGWAQASK